MTMASKKAWLECCGCGDVACPGCCFPTTEDGLDFLPIPFCLSSASCPTVDGICGEFTDDAIEPQNKVCGSCGSFSWIDGPFEIPSVSYNPDGMGGCDEIPGLGLTIHMQLYCDAEMGVPDDTSDEICCRRLRLVCGTSYETTGSDPDYVIPELGQFITIIEPASCTCDPFAVTFSLCRLTPKPQVNPSPECPFPPGYEVPECDPCGISVVI